MASTLGAGCLVGKAARGSNHSTLQQTRVQRQQSTFYPAYSCPPQKARRQPEVAAQVAAPSSVAESTGTGLGLWEAAGGTAASHAASWGLNNSGELGLPLDFSTYYQLGRQIGAGAYGTVYEATEK